MRKESASDLAFEHVILRLNGDELFPAHHLSDVVTAAKLPRRKIARADITDFALADEIIERAHHLFDGCRVIPPMNLIQINMICPQPTQTRLNCIRNVIARCTLIVWSITHCGATLCSNDDSIPLTSQRRTNIFLRDAFAIHISCIEKVDSLVQSTIDNGFCPFFIHLAAELIASDSNG